MWGYAFMFLVLAGTMSYVTRVGSNDRIQQTHAQAAAIAGSMMVYRNKVITYAQANTGVTGAVADSSLSLPTWYSRQSTIANYVAGGKGYVYVTTVTAELPYLIAKKLDGSINVGINQGGYLVNPLSTTNTSTPIALPAAIPTGSVVIAP